MNTFTVYSVGESLGRYPCGHGNWYKLLEGGFGRYRKQTFCDPFSWGGGSELEVALPSARTALRALGGSASLVAENIHTGTRHQSPLFADSHRLYT